MLVSLWGAPPTINAQSYRSGKIAKYLSRLGHELFVLSHRCNPGIPIDENLVKDMSSLGKVTEYQLRRSILPKNNRFVSVLNILGMPDNYGPWVLGNFKKISRIIDRERIDTVITSNTPSAYILGALLSKKKGIHWIADLADLWVGNPGFLMPTRYHQSLQAHFESSTFKHVSGITYPVESWDEMLSKRFPGKPICYIPNSYDKEDFSQPFQPDPNPNDRVTFCYLGTIYRDFDLAFLKATVELIKAHPELKSKIKYRLIGQIGPKKAEEIKSYSKHFEIDLLGIIDHSTMISELKASDFLIFSIGAGSFAQYSATARLPMYLGSGKPVIACCIPSSPSDSLFRRYGCWRIADARDITGIMKCIEEACLVSGSSDIISRGIPSQDSLKSIEWSGTIDRLDSFLGSICK